MTKNLNGKHSSKIVHLPPPTVCRYCGGKVELVNNSEVYGRPRGRWPFVYLCKGCKAKVGVHPTTKIPLGTLADRDLQAARLMVHRIFDDLWRSGTMTRRHAYRLLSRKMGIPADRCHIGQFEMKDCLRAEKIAKELTTQGR